MKLIAKLLPLEVKLEGNLLLAVSHVGDGGANKIIHIIIIKSTIMIIMITMIRIGMIGIMIITIIITMITMILIMLMIIMIMMIVNITSMLYKL